MTPTPTHYYLVGIKGVAMTALAQVLVDAGHQVSGSDVAEDFVTAPQLQRLGVRIDEFSATLPHDVTQVIFTAAHQAGLHPQVQAARQAGIPVRSHAEELAFWFNQKQGIAVCGVGGKSTISAMISWILEKTGRNPSYAVGVGDIIGLGRSGRWRSEGSHFIAEADEYATDPVAVKQGQQLVPRFAFLKPEVIVASTISFDHPDVYADETHTRAVFTRWFSSQAESGILISDETNRPWLESQRLPQHRIWYGSEPESDIRLIGSPSFEHQTAISNAAAGNTTFTLRLGIPGRYNLRNALAAVAAAGQCGIDPVTAAEALADFQSTKRRFEFKGNKAGVLYYDDYAHHPREVAVVLEAAREWFPDQRVIVAFQPHTYSRTKALLNEFAAALSTHPTVILLDIFSSARESDDPSISSDLLAEAIRRHGESTSVMNLKTLPALADYCSRELRAGDVLLTIGAGDVYTVHDLLGVHHG